MDVVKECPKLVRLQPDFLIGPLARVECIIVKVNYVLRLNCFTVK